MGLSLKILHIVTQLELGGAQISALNILEGLDRDKYQPTLLSSYGLLAERAQKIPGLSVQWMPSLQRTINPIRDMYTLIKLTRFIKQGGYDMVHTHSSKAGILGRWAAYLAKVPAIIHTVHGFGFHAFQSPWVQQFYQGLERLTARITRGIILVSKEDHSTVLRLKIGRADQFRLIRYGIDVQRFELNKEKPKLRREDIGLNVEGPVIGTVACLKPQKAPLDFVKACYLIKQKVPRAQFLWVGDGVLKAPAERLSEQLGLKNSIYWMGWRYDVPQLLEIMDVFMLSSRWEGLPVACIEALASGLPVVATQVGGIPELIKHEYNGMLTAPAHPEGLARAAVHLLKNGDIRAKIAEKGRLSLNEQFTLQHMVRETEQYYDDLWADNSVIPVTQCSPPHLN